MASIASGGIAIWEGGSLWAFHVAAAPLDAPPPSTDRHAHHAMQLTLSLGGEFAVTLGDGRSLAGPAVLVAADVPHAFTAAGDIAVLFIEPESGAGRALHRQVAADGAAASQVSLPPDAHAQLERIRRALQASAPDRAALRSAGAGLIDAMARQAAAAPAPIPPSDPRVRRMIEWACAHLDEGEGVGIEGAARAVDLSASRASHLFVEHTGLAFRTWLLWQRAMRAVERYDAGASLTQAAHDAGFADSAHLSRTFRRLFGLPATALTLR